MSFKRILNEVTGKEAFEVDESFVMEQIGDQINDEERELINKFVEQSQEEQLQTKLEATEKDTTVQGAFYRICNVPKKECDDSPLGDIEHPERITSRKRSVFAHEGQMIQTDGTGKNTKLSKVYKRGDNRGALLGALKRMKLNI